MRLKHHTTLFLSLVALFFPAGCQSLPQSGSRSRADVDPPIVQNVPDAPALYYFSMAQMRLKQGNLNEAIWLMEKAGEFDPKSDYLKLELANLYLIKKELIKALDVVNEVLDQSPDHIQALTLAGRIYQQQNDTAGARQAFEKVLAEDGDDPNIYLFLGRFYWDSHDMENAGRVFRKMAARFPESYVAHYFHGMVLSAQGKDKRAEEAFLKSLDLEPSLEEPRLELLKIYKKQNRPKKIIQIYHDIIANNPENYQVVLGLAQYHHQNNNQASAGEILSELGRRVEDDDKVIKTLFEEYLEPKDYENAEWILKAMLRGAPQNSDLHYLIGVVYDGLSQSEPALEHLQQVAPQSRFYHNAAVLSALLFHDTGQIDRAIDVIEKAQEQDPGQADYYLYLGSFFEELERYNDAIDVLLRGLEVDDGNSRLYFRLGVVYDKMGRKEESIAAMQAVVRLKPDNAEALNYLGYTYADLGINLDEAEALIQTALKIKPDDGYITDSMGWLNYKRGRYQDALKYLHRAMELVPDDPVILEHVGDVYLKMNRPQKALLYYNRSLEKKNKNKDALEDKIKRIKSE